MSELQRIRTTHVGSLPRPESLIATLLQKHRGEANADDEARLTIEVNDAVTDVVRKQAEIGLDIINDGEMGKTSYSGYAAERLTGFSGESSWRPLADIADFPGFAERYAQRTTTVATFAPPACIDAIAYVGQSAIHADLDRLTAVLSAVGRSSSDAFITAASPGVIAMSLTNRYYPTHESYVMALAEAMKAEYRAIVEAGFTLHLDAPDLGMGRHGHWAEATLDEFRDIVQLHVDAINLATADLPSERMRLHLCWGNYDGPHHYDVPLGEILDIVLTARPAGLSFEAANPRHEHEWRIWTSVSIPDGKYLIPGVIDTTTNYIEHPDLVAERLKRFAEIVGPERVIAGTDCGLSSFAGYAPVDPDIAWAKLETLVEGARRACLP